MDKKKYFDDPSQKIDELIKKRDKEQHVYVPKSEGLQKIYDNIKFTEKVKDDPILLKRDYRGVVSGEAKYRVISLDNFLELRLYPRSIYVTDKLLRLVASSRLEWLKKYLSKKRSMPLNVLWIILIVMGVIIAVVVILLLLPKFMG